MHPSPPSRWPSAWRRPSASYRFFFSHFFGHVFERIFHDFWLPSGGPKSPKIAPGAEKVRSGTASHAIFVGFWCRCRSESLSGPILTRFFTEIRAWIERAFSRKHLFFLDGATSRIVCNLHIETHFFIFLIFCIFYRKEDEKSSWKPRAGEALEKVAPGPSWEPFWGPKSIKIARATPEKLKNRWKK